jgi:hypothetical protein
MGWSSGTRLLSDIIDTVQKYVDDEDIRVEIYKEIADSFESADCDELSECLGTDDAFDRMMEETDRIDPFDEDYE